MTTSTETQPASSRNAVFTSIRKQMDELPELDIATARKIVGLSTLTSGEVTAVIEQRDKYFQLQPALAGQLGISQEITVFALQFAELLREHTELTRELERGRYRLRIAPTDKARVKAADQIKATTQSLGANEKQSASDLFNEVRNLDAKQLLSIDNSPIRGAYDWLSAFKRTHGVTTWESMFNVVQWFYLYRRL